MNHENGKPAFPVFRYTLRLKERQRLSEADMHEEQAELRKLITAADPNAGRRGDPGDPYLGVGYPLACWLDETFILSPESPWKGKWKEEALEVSLYGCRDRAHRFWEQSRQAEGRGDIDALEVFYLCVMLGFRGDLRDQPEKLRDWRERVESVLGRGRWRDWPGKPLELPVPPPDVPPRTGKDRLRWMLLAWALLGGVAILATAFILVLTGRG